MAAKRRPPPPPPPPPPQPASSASTYDEGSSSGDEEHEQARYLFQKKSAPPSEATKISTAATADDTTMDGEEDDDDEESSEDEDEEEEKQKVKEKPKEQREEEEEGSSDEEEDDDEDEDRVEANNQTKITQPQQTSQKVPQPPGSSTETGSGSSESDDEVTLPSTLATASRPSRTKDLSIKPISSRPIDGSTAKPIASPPHLETPLKGKGETQNRSEVHSASVSQKKQMFQRLWSIQDELAVLRGMVEYRDKHQILPMHSQDMPRFLDFIKGSLGVEVSKTQLGDKVRRLKKKFTTADARNNGADPALSNSHDKAVYELSKKIWGTESTTPVAKLMEGDAELSEESESNGSARDVNAEHAKSNLTFPYLSEIIMKMDEGTPIGLGIKRSFELMDPGKAALLEQKVKKLKLKGMRLQLKVMDLVKESMKLVVDSLATSE